MPPHNGLTHLKEYDIKDSNVEFIGTDIDHNLKYASALTEPAWNNGIVGRQPGIFTWRIENFEVVPWPKNKAGQFYDGDSYIVLYSYKVGQGSNEHLGHEIYFWLGTRSSQDERGVAAYKTVELDEFLAGKATQRREVQASPSDDFLSLFPKIKILRGGVESGFTHVEEEAPMEITTLLRVFKHGRSTLVFEVEPTWQSLSEEDVFILDKGDKIWVWQGKSCTAMEKAKAAQVVNDMTLAKHVDVEVLAQTESRSAVVVKLLGGDVGLSNFKAERPVAGGRSSSGDVKKLFRLSDASGQLAFNVVKDGSLISKTDFDTKDVFILDTGNTIWVWRGLGASAAEKAAWLKVAQSYIQQNMKSAEVSLSSVVEGYESPAFWKAIEA